MKKSFVIIVSIILSILFARAKDSINVSGSVKDTEGKPVPGVVVMLKGDTGKAAITDANGAYTITVPVSSADKARLEASCMGYQTQTVELRGRAVINFVLQDDITTLDDAVVVGYGAMRRSDLTGSVTSVKINETEASKTASLSGLLQGHAAGVQVVNSSAAPDAAVSVRIRGLSTFSGSTEPLYVVDGIILNTDATMNMENFSEDNSNGLMGINPNDIASIEVLKDASATAIYGSQASNGVILITTRTASRTKPVVTFNVGVDISNRYKIMDMLNLDEYVLFQDRLNDNLLGYPSYAVTGKHSEYAARVFDSNGNYCVTPMNWQDYMLRTAVSQRYYLSIAGKPNNINYMFSLGYKKAEGIIKTTGFDNITARLNLEYDFNKYIKIGTRSNFSYLNSNLTQGASVGDLTNSASMMRSMISSAPYNRIVTGDDDIFDLDDGGDTYNSSPERWLQDFQSTKAEFRVNPNLYLQFKILPWLNFKTSFGADYRASEQNKFTSRRINAGITGSYAIISHVNRLNWNWDNMFMFNKSFKGGHYLSGTVGMTMSGTQMITETVRADQIDEYKAKSDAINSSDNNTMTYSEVSGTLVSFLGRVIYNYKNRYVITSTLRFDGSSKFRDANKWGCFPSFAGAWRLSEEQWFKVPVISLAKFRVGWGRVGNQAISSYQTMSNYAGSIYPDHTATNPSEGSVGLVPQNMANNDLKWESTDQTNIGLDLGLWKGRFSLSFDAYYKITTDLLQNKKISVASGFERMWMNYGSIENKGIELTLDTTPVKVKDFEWNLGGNISMNRNTILKIGEESEAGDIYVSPTDKQHVSFFYGGNLGWGTVACNPLNIFIEGQPMGLFYGFVSDGYVQEGEMATVTWAGETRSLRPGEMKYKDLNGDGKIDDNDRTVIGNPTPVFTYGINTTFRYKGITLFVDCNGSYGNDVFNENRKLNASSTGNRANNFEHNMLTDCWTPSNSVNPAYPTAGYISAYEERVISDTYVEDGSYFRLATVSLSYEIPLKKRSKPIISGINVGFSGSNLLVVTNYTGFDPEVNSHNSLTRMGADMGSYPGARTYNFDIKLKF